VEDDEVVRFMLGAYLGGAGHKVDLAADGLEGWHKASADLAFFEVIVTDFDMPGCAGLKLVELLREAHYRGQIIVFSSSLSPRDRENFEAVGVDAIIEKGDSPAALLAAVERIPDPDDPARLRALP